MIPRTLLRCGFHDGETWYIRSGADPNKCLIETDGSTAAGTRLAIQDCVSGDVKFMFDRYTDGSIRPREAADNCIRLSSNMIDGSNVLELWACADTSQQWTWYA